MDTSTLRVRTAHADAWQAVGLARPAGRTGDVRGARLMSSGIADPRWNNADVTSPDPDVAAIETWYREQDVPWGVRVPVEWAVDVGTPLFVKRAFGRLPGGAERPGGTDLDVRRCDDLDAFVAAEVAVFGDDPGLIRTWVGPTFEHPSFGYWIAEDDGSIAAIATTISSDGEAGPATMITGLASIPSDREQIHTDKEANALSGAAVGDQDQMRHGIHTAAGVPAETDPRVGICYRILEEASGDTLVHAYAATGDEVALWFGLGFVEVSGFTVRVVRDR